MKFKQFLVSKGITEDAFGKMEASEQAKLHTEFLDTLEGVSKSEFNALKTELETLKTNGVEKSVIDTLKGQLDELALELKEVENKGAKSTEIKSFLEAVKEQKDELKSVVKGGTEKEIVLKADTLRSSITDNTDAFKLTGIGQLGVKLRSLYDLFRKVQVPVGDHNGVIRYHDWDEATTVSSANMVAEGGTFPESTAKFQEYKIDLKKIGDTLPVSDEFGEDEVSASAELEMFLETNVNSKVDNQIALGDGVGQNLTGLVTSVPAYAPVASGIAGANIYDLVKKVKTDIVKNRGSKYQPNFVAMNSDTADRLHLEKDLNNNYVFKDVANIGQMVIVEDNNLADNTLVVGDSRYATIYERGGIVMSKNFSGTQFVEDMITLKIRKRMLFLIRNVDKTGFRKVTNITTALATLES